MCNKNVSNEGLLPPSCGHTFYSLQPPGDGETNTTPVPGKTLRKRIPQPDHGQIPSTALGQLTTQIKGQDFISVPDWCLCTSFWSLRKNFWVLTWAGWGCCWPPSAHQCCPMLPASEAEEGGPAPRLPCSCCQQQDCQKEALFSEERERSQCQAEVSRDSWPIRDFKENQKTGMEDVLGVIHTPNRFHASRVL